MKYRENQYNSMQEPLMPMKLEELEETLKLKLDVWQKEFILADERQLILKMGRKCGKTTAMAVKIVYDCLNKNFEYCDGICILSRGQRQSKEVFMQVRSMLMRLGISFSKNPDEDEAYSSTTQIILPGTDGKQGNKVYSLPCGYDGVTVRYYSFYKIFRDEDAFIPEAVDAAVGACLAVHGVQEVRASTPYGNSGSFYEAWHNPDFRRWEKRTSECTRVPKEFLERERKKLTKAEYDMEYNGQFTEMAEGIYTNALIKACSYRDANWEELAKRCPTFIGVDFARFGEDENAIAINNYDPKIRTSHVQIKIMHSSYRTTQVVGALVNMTRKYPMWKMIVTDDVGIGAGPTDLLIERLGKRKVIGISNHKRPDEVAGGQRRFMKTDLHMNLIRQMENGRIILDDDMEIVRSLKSMKFKYTEHGELAIYGKNNHAAEAIVRAVFPVQLKRSAPLWVHNVEEPLLKAETDDLPWER